MASLFLLRSSKKQTGTFVVEFAVISFALALVIAFCGDVVVRMSLKGKLDRAAYSAMTIIKERTALFPNSSNLSDPSFLTLDNTQQKIQFDQLASIVKGSLQRTISSQAIKNEDFGMVLEVQNFLEQPDSKTYKLSDDTNSLECKLGDGLAGFYSIDKDNNVATPKQDLSLNLKPTLYRVTICYRTVNWYGKALDILAPDYAVVSSNAISVER